MSTRTLRIALFALLLGIALPTGALAQWSTDTLTESRHSLALVTSGGKSYFAGGRDGPSASDRIDIYDEATDSWSTAALTVARSHMAAAAVGPYVLFTGGLGATASDVVDIYDAGLGGPEDPGAWSTTTLSTARFLAAATTVGSKALFGGGYGGSLSAPVASDVVDIYDADLGAPDDPGAWSTATLSVPRGRLAAATAGDHALFAGGRNDAPFGSWVVYDTVDIYDDTTGSWSTTVLTQARAQIGATSTGARAYFAGGDSADGLSLVYDTVDVYEPATGMGTPLALSVPRMGVGATAVGNTVLFAGGHAMLGGGVTVVDVLDDATGAWGPTASLSADKGGMAATTVGDTALFASGVGSAGATSTVEVYESPWTDLGGGTLGVAGQPTLTGFGSLEGGTTASVFLADAPPSAAMLAWISFAPVPFSALGGTVHAFPFTNQLGLVSSGAGSFGAGTTWPAGLPTGTQVWFQFIVADVSSIHGLTLSNGLRATSP